VKAQTIKEALLLVQQGFRQINDLVVERRSGRRTELIPELGQDK
jgi:hypothetical protein